MFEANFGVSISSMVEQLLVRLDELEAQKDQPEEAPPAEAKEE